MFSPSRFFSWSVLLLAFVVLAAGCGKGGKRIIILTNGTSPFWDAAKIGAFEAAKDFDLAKDGLEVVFHTNDFTDKGQIDALRDFQGMTDIAAVGISITNSGNSGIAKEMKKLAEQGVKIIAIDSDVNLTKDRDSREAYIGTNNVYGGQELGKAVKGLRPEGGIFSAFVGNKGAANAIERHKGFVEGVGGKFTGKEFLGDQGDRTVARKNVLDSINRNDKDGLNILVGIWSYNGPAIVDTVKKLDRRDDFTIVTFDAEPGAIAEMKKGNIDALAVQNPHAMGYQGVRMLQALVKGNTAVIDEMRKEMNRLPDQPDLFDTGLKIIIPDEGSPLAEVQFGDNTTKWTLSKFTEWLKSKDLQGS